MIFTNAIKANHDEILPELPSWVRGEGGGNCVPGVFLRVLYRAADVELKSSLKLIGYVLIRF